MGNMGTVGWSTEEGKRFARTGQGKMEVGMDFGEFAILYALCHKSSLLE